MFQERCRKGVNVCKIHICVFYFIAPVYQFVWDNVGKQSHARFQGRNKNANHLWALTAAVENRNDFWHLSDEGHVDAAVS